MPSQSPNFHQMRDSSYFAWGTSFPIFFFSLSSLPLTARSSTLPSEYGKVVTEDYCHDSCKILRGTATATIQLHSAEGHFVCVHAQSLSRVWLAAAPWTVAYQAPSVHRVSQARILEWAAISFSRGSSQPRDRAQVSCMGRGVLSHWATQETLKAILEQQQLYQRVSSTRALSSRVFGSPQCWQGPKLNIFLFLLVSHLDSPFWPHLSTTPATAVYQSRVYEKLSLARQERLDTPSLSRLLHAFPIWLVFKIILSNLIRRFFFF